MRLVSRTFITLALLGLALGVAGCAGGAGWAATLTVLMSLGALFAAGCSQAHEGRDDAGPVDSGPDSTTPPGDAGGYWEDCCLAGRIDTCFCPAGVACNYGWFTPCGGDTCTFGPVCPGEDAGTDAGVDAGPEGTWEPCCVDGLVDTCFCPGGAECNYGWYTDCGDGTCVDPSTMCPAP